MTTKKATRKPTARKVAKKRVRKPRVKAVPTPEQAPENPTDLPPPLMEAGCSTSAAAEDPRRIRDVHISGCSIASYTAANEHTRVAVVALADALKENAASLGKAADALKGGDAMRAGIHIGGGWPL